MRECLLQRIDKYMACGETLLIYYTSWTKTERLWQDSITQKCCSWLKTEL